jgi:hypothetical protein
VSDLTDGPALPGQEDRQRLEALRAELDLSPASLRETLDTAMAIEAGRPRLKPDGAGRDRLVTPVPAVWQEVVDATLRGGGPTGPLLALVFDPEHYVQQRSGRPVFLPEPDSRLLHLGHALYHRVMSTFARYRFPGGPKAATRWSVRTGAVPEGADAVLFLTLEELAVNQLREPCHHWVRTVALPVAGGTLHAPLAHQPPAAWATSAVPGEVSRARTIWEDVEDEVKALSQSIQLARTGELKARLAEAGKLVGALEKKRFERRRKELERAAGENQLERLRQDMEKLRSKARQLSFHAEENEALLRQVSDKEAEIQLRRRHYEVVLQRLAQEERRTLDRILPPRYQLRGEARVYPIAVEIRLPGASA